MAARKEWVPNGLRNAFTSMERVLVGNDSRRWETFERERETPNKEQFATMIHFRLSHAKNASLRQSETS